MDKIRFFRSTPGMTLTATAATLLWGSAFPLIKLSYEALAIGPEESGRQILFAGYRFFLAAMLIFLVTALLRQPIGYRRGTFLPLLRVGLVQTSVQYVLFYIGLGMATGIQGSVIAGTTSFFQILFARWMLRDEPITVRKCIGLLIGFSGVVLVNLDRGSLAFDWNVGALLLLGAMMAGSLGNVLAREGSARMGVFYLTAWQMLFGSVGLILAGAARAGWAPFAFDWMSGLMLLYLAFLSAAGFVLWNTVMKFNPVGKVSAFLFLIPVFGVTLSALLLGEALHLFVLLGLALVAAGIVVVNREKKAARVRERQARTA